MGNKHGEQVGDGTQTQGENTNTGRTQTQEEHKQGEPRHKVWEMYCENVIDGCLDACLYFTQADLSQREHVGESVSSAEGCAR